MALIKCPECGREISDRADRCVHCGCHIIVCPECGQAAVAGSEVCTNCGMKFGYIPIGQEQKQTIESKYIFQTADNFQKAWENENGSKKALNRALKHVGEVTALLAVALFILGIVLLTHWTSEMKSPDVALGALLKAKDMLQDLNIIIAFVVIFVVTSNLSFILAEYFLPYQYSKWILKKHILAKEILIKSEPAVDWSSKESVSRVMSKNTVTKGLYWAEQGEEKKTELVLRAISCLFTALICIFVAVALHNNLDAYLSSILLTGDFEFEYVYLIFATVFLAAKIVYDFVCGYCLENKIEKWVKNIKTN